MNLSVIERTHHLMAISTLLLDCGVNRFNIGVTSDGCIWFWARESEDKIDEIRFHIVSYLFANAIQAQG